MKNGEEPLIVGEANGKAIGLAVRHGNTALPVLLDDRLQRVELTDNERTAALAPFAYQQEGDRSVPVLIEDTKRAVSIWKRLQLFFGVLLLIVVGVVGFWLWYVTTSTTAFQSRHGYQQSHASAVERVGMRAVEEAFWSGSRAVWLRRRRLYELEIERRRPLFDWALMIVDGAIGCARGSGRPKRRNPARL